MQSVKVIHLLKRVEQIDAEIAELHGLVDGISAGRSYRNTMKIAAEQQINNLVGERVKLMELKIENPPEYLTKQVYREEEAKSNQPRISLEGLLGASNSTHSPTNRELISKEEQVQAGSLRDFTRMMTVDEILPRVGTDAPSKSRRTEKAPVKTRADILRDLPPLQY